MNVQNIFVVGINKDVILENFASYSLVNLGMLMSIEKSLKSS